MTRPGYRSFLGLLRLLWHQNRVCRSLDVKVKLEITLPVKWL